MQICTRQETNYWNIEQDYWAENVIRYYAKAVKERKNFDMHNESLFMCLFCCLIFSFVMLCGLATCLFIETQFTYTHIHRTSERLKRQLLFLPSFFPRKPREEKKNKMVEYAFLFCIRISSCFPSNDFICSIFVPRAIPSIARNGKRVQHLETCNATEI